MTKQEKEDLIDYYKELNRYGEILYTGHFSHLAGYASVKMIKFKQCLHVVELLNGEVTKITLLF